jgi:curved DNA-binding protein
MNYYETLSVSKDATPEEIKKSYRKLVKEHHPDKTGGDDSQFKKISEAYETLSDPVKKEQYDNPSRGHNPFGNFQRNQDTSSAWQHAFHGFGGDFTDMFNQSFGGQARGYDVRVTLNITIEESYGGVRKYIDVGTGGFNINIPRGIQTGTKLKVPGRGANHPVNSSAPPGDIILTVNVLPDPELIVNGSDIYVELTLSWIDLLLGGEFDIHTKLNSIKIKVPQGSHESQFLRVVGQGMPIYNAEGFGNLIVKLRTLPITLTETEIELLKKIKNPNEQY